MKRCFLLLADGLRPDVAERELAAGALPNLAEMTAHGGRARAISVFPSTTSVAYLPFLTGCSPGRCNIPSIRWMDRSTYGGRWWRDREEVRSYCGYQAARLDGDIAPDVQTIFQLVPESMAIFTMISRGLTAERDPSQRERWLMGGLAHYAQWHQPYDNTAARYLLKAVKEPWRFVFAQFPAVDGYTHQSTPDGPKVIQALRRVDRVVGQLRGELARRGELDDTLILLVSDHGAAVINTHLDLADWFRAQGVPTLSHPVIWERAPRAAVMIAGNCSAMIYARPGERRSERWPMERLRGREAFGTAHDVIEALVREPAVAFVAAEAGAGALSVVSRTGEARLRVTDGRIDYQPVSGDPLELGGPLTGDAAEWLERTWDAPYPDAGPQLLDQFRSPRSGDLIVVAREGYDFRERFEVPEHKSGHGSMIRSHMQTPLWSSAPLPGRALRTMDVFPAMLSWLGVEVPTGISAESVWLPGREAEALSGA
jgi:type I phosphodiesterase/nucleotide pyrophosphatase